MIRTSWPGLDTVRGLTPHQRQRLSIAWTRPWGILGGNPGAGKTYTTARVIQSVIDYWGPEELVVCAPTGKASVRITESLLKSGVQGIEATTIHRALGVNRNGHDGDGWGFTFNESNPFKAKFVFVDESSMLDTTLCSNLLSACEPGTHGMFIGDFGQLAPVGHGRPLCDMIFGGIPYGELTENHRNEGDVERACRELKEGKLFRPSTTKIHEIDLKTGKNLLHIECAGGDRQRDTLCKMLMDVPFGFDPVWDVQVLCAVNEDTPVARDALNKSLQEVLNPHGRKIADNGRFRMGDKVICGTNMFTRKVFCSSHIFCADPEPRHQYWAEKDKKYNCQTCGSIYGPKDLDEEFVANGEIGKIVGLWPGVLHVEFTSPARTLRIAGESIKEFELAYAVTTHKSQGSQWPICIVVCDDTSSGDFVTSWEWWRTGLSRIETLCVTLGRKAAIDRQCRKSALKDRKTFLGEKLRRMVA